MRSFLTSAFLAVALASGASAQSGSTSPPPLYTGANGIVVTPGTLRAHPGELHRGDVVVELGKHYARTGRLAADYADGDFHLAAGTPMFATRFLYVRPAGAPDGPIEDDTNRWCTASQTLGMTCFWWTPSHFMRSLVPMASSSSPSQRTALGEKIAPEPTIHEETIDIAGPLRSDWTIDDLNDQGVIVREHSREGDKDWSFPRPVIPWNTTTQTHFDRTQTVLFEPIRDGANAITAVRVTFGVLATPAPHSN